MENLYKRGSKWRRWDLHIHTPESALNNHFSDWSEYLDKLESFGSDVEVIGVTDYTTIEGYKKLREEKENGRIPNILEIFPNIEFRITPETSRGKGLNIHLIVNPEEENHIEEIENALSRLTFEYNGQPYSCTVSGLTSLGNAVSGGSLTEGVNQFKPSFAVIKRWYDSERWLCENSLVVVANGSGDGVSGLRADSGLQATREEVYRFSHMVFSATPSDREYFLGLGVDDKEAVKTKCGALKPCVHGSDAHDLDSIFNPDQNRYCWIKADPTFNGLKQVCFEPDSRVRIHDAHPDLEFKKPYFSSITCEGYVFGEGLPKFCKTEIPLNSGLVTLIGGRGAGKSLLLDCLYKLFNRDKLGSSKRLENISPESYTVQFSKSDGSIHDYNFGADADLEYLHVKQGDIKSIADSPSELSNQIKRLLSISVTGDKPEYDYEIESIIERIEKSLAWFDMTDAEDHLVNDLNRNQKIIQTNQNLIETITTDENKDSIQSYQTNNQEINKRQTSVTKLNDLKIKLNNSKIELDREIAEANGMETEGLDIPSVDFVPQTDQINVVLEALQVKIKEFTDSNLTIEQQFKDIGINQDVAGLLDKIEQYQREINRAQEKVSEFSQKQTAIENDIQHRTELVAKIDEDLNEQLQKIRESFKIISDGKDSWSVDQKTLVSKLLKEINIDGSIVFDADVFYKGLIPLLNGNKFRSTGAGDQQNKIESKFNVQSYDDYLKLIKNEKIIDDGDGGHISLNELAVQKDYFLKNNFNIYEYLYLYSYRKDYLYVNPVIQYLGKSPDELSVGQRGTFYVCMKLATDPFGSPFIFDQPEDDLDNKFIMSELVPLFREIKNYRQVIIATHNANLVVNADAEQVILANNEGENLGYNSGSLENSSNQEPYGIRQNVCDILEGGRVAFESREKKYGFTD